MSTTIKLCRSLKLMTVSPQIMCKDFLGTAKKWTLSREISSYTCFTLIHTDEHKQWLNFLLLNTFCQIVCKEITFRTNTFKIYRPYKYSLFLYFRSITFQFQVHYLPSFQNIYTITVPLSHPVELPLN